MLLLMLLLMWVSLMLMFRPRPVVFQNPTRIFAQTKIVESVSASTIVEVLVK
jgi:hypothetical protein